MTRSHINCSFILKFDDQCVWNLTGTRGTETWLQEFASVLGLQAGNREGLPQIQFIRRSPAEPSTCFPELPPDLAELNRLTGQSWEPNNFGFVRIWSSQGGSDLVCELVNSPARKLAVLMMGQALQPLCLKAVEFQGISLHGALLAHKGLGVILAGANDAGKSTCCSRLPPAWKVLSDDESLLIRRDDGGYFAHPLPTWSDHFQQRSGYCCDVQQRVALAAVFFLEQAPCLEILPMGKGRAAGAIYESARQACFWRFQGPENREREVLGRRLFENACEVAKRVPAYTLRLNLTDKFWEPIEQLLACP